MLLLLSTEELVFYVGSGVTALLLAVAWLAGGFESGLRALEGARRCWRARPARERRIIVVDGLIGAGKSTFLQWLEREGFDVLQEPLDDWRALEGKHNLLEDFYRDQDRYGTVFQMFTLLTRWMQIDRRHLDPLSRASKRPDLLFIERGVLGDSVFAEVMHKRGTISTAWKAVYDATFHQILRHMPPVSKVLWLDVKPAQALERMRARNRGEEVAGVDLSYLSDLYETAQAVYDRSGIPFVAVSGDYDFRAAPDPARPDPFRALRRHLQ